jgi:hypothetical protein
VAQPAVGGLDPPPEGPEHAAFWDNFQRGTPVSGGSTSKPTVVSAPRRKTGRKARGKMKSGAASRARRRRRG